MGQRGPDSQGEGRREIGTHPSQHSMTCVRKNAKMNAIILSTNFKSVLRKNGRSCHWRVLVSMEKTRFAFSKVTWGPGRPSLPAGLQHRSLPLFRDSWEGFKRKQQVGKMTEDLQNVTKGSLELEWQELGLSSANQHPFRLH